MSSASVTVVTVPRRCCFRVRNTTPVVPALPAVRSAPASGAGVGALTGGQRPHRRAARRRRTGAAGGALADQSRVDLGKPVPEVSAADGCPLPRTAGEGSLLQCDGDRGSVDEPNRQIK